MSSPTGLQRLAPPSLPSTPVTGVNKTDFKTKKLAGDLFAMVAVAGAVCMLVGLGLFLANPVSVSALAGGLLLGGTLGLAGGVVASNCLNNMAEKQELMGKTFSKIIELHPNEGPNIGLYAQKTDSLYHTKLRLSHLEEGERLLGREVMVEKFKEEFPKPDLDQLSKDYGPSVLDHLKSDVDSDGIQLKEEEIYIQSGVESRTSPPTRENS